MSTKQKGYGKTSLSARRPTWTERAYDVLDAPERALSSLFGVEGPNDRLSSAVEGLFGANELENAGRRTYFGKADANDYTTLALNAGLAALPALKPVGRLAARGVKRLAPEAVKSGAKAAAKFAARPAYLSDKALVKAVREGRAVDRQIAKNAPAVNRAKEAQFAARPKYNREEVGNRLNVAREDVAPQIVPEALTAPNLNALRVILKNPETNPAFNAADEYTRAKFGRGYDLAAREPGTSLRKQSGIARVFQEGLEGSPAYKSAIFEAYGNQMPQVVEQARAQNYDQLLEAAYRQLGSETRDQFASLPVRTSYHFGDGEYAAPSDMLRDVLGRGNLNVYRGGDPHEFLSELDPDTGLSLNEMFRAVHDFYGHGTTGTTFRPGGEEAAYASHGQMMSPLAQMALMPETRGQNSLVNYSPLNIDLLEKRNPLLAQIADIEKLDRMRGTPGASAAQTAPLKAQLRDLAGDWQYAPQKTLLLPPEYLAADTQGGVPDYLQSVIQPRAGTQPERAVHLSHTPGLAQTDPSYYGTGHRGDDWAVRGQRGSPAEKTSFYLGAPGTVRPEKYVADVSPYAYEASLGGLYDIGSDPENLVRLARTYNPGRSAIPDFARMVKEYGYRGYRTPEFTPGQGAADVYYPVDLERAITRGEGGY